MANYRIAHEMYGEAQKTCRQKRRASQARTSGSALVKFETNLFEAQLIMPLANLCCTKPAPDRHGLPKDVAQQKRLVNTKTGVVNKEDAESRYRPQCNRISKLLVFLLEAEMPLANYTILSTCTCTYREPHMPVRAIVAVKPLECQYQVRSRKQTTPYPWGCLLHRG